MSKAWKLECSDLAQRWIATSLFGPRKSLGIEILSAKAKRAASNTSFHVVDSKSSLKERLASPEGKKEVGKVLYWTMNEASSESGMNKSAFAVFHIFAMVE